MVASKTSNPVVLLDNLHLAGLQAQVDQTVRNERRRPQVLERLLARDALIAMLQDGEQLDADFEIDIRLGFGANHRLKEFLDLVDVWINDRIIGAWPTRSSDAPVWLNRAQVEAQSAPDVWVIVMLTRHPEGVHAELLGWNMADVLRDIRIDENGLREIKLAHLLPAEELEAFLLKHPEKGRTGKIDYKPERMKQMRAELDRPDLAQSAGSQIRPLSQIDPDGFDCLAADPDLAEKYVEAVARSPEARVRVLAPAAWTLKQPRRSIVDWLKEMANAASEQADAFWQGALSGLASPQLALASAASRAAETIHIVDATDPDRAAETIVAPELSLIQEEAGTRLDLFAQMALPVEHAYLVVLNKANVEWLNHQLGLSLNVADLFRVVVRTPSAEIDRYMTRNVLVYPAEVRDRQFIDLRVSLPRQIEALPPDLHFVLLID